MRTLKPVIGLLCLSLLLLSTGCALPRKKPLETLRLVETTKTELITIPDFLLEPCPVLPLPDVGDQNLTLAEQNTSRYIGAIDCNKRFDAIREYQDGLKAEFEKNGNRLHTH